MNYSSLQTFSLVTLRVLIGWHLLYEGLIKVMDPSWSSITFLRKAQGPLAGIFHTLTSHKGLLEIVDFLNEWGLVCIGVSLMLGLLTRIGIVSGMALLILYYSCNPPFIGLDQSPGTEGNYLIINKNLIEAAALLVLFCFPTVHIYGLDRFFRAKI